MDHAWIMSHDLEIGHYSMKDFLSMNDLERSNNSKLDAFRDYALAYKNNGVFLVDTYNTKNGIENGIVVLKELREIGFGKNYGFRFDSEDVVYWSLYTLRRFFEEELIENNLSKEEIKNMSNLDLLKASENLDFDLFCCASDNINEEKIWQFRNQGCFIKFWGVGTAGCYLPPLGITYKLSELSGKSIAKFSGVKNEKFSLPGKLNSKYIFDENNKIKQVLIFDENTGLSKDCLAFNFYKKEFTKYSVDSLSINNLCNVKNRKSDHNYFDLDSLKEDLKFFEKGDRNSQNGIDILIDKNLWDLYENILNKKIV